MCCVCCCGVCASGVVVLAVVAVVAAAAPFPPARAAATAAGWMLGTAPLMVIDREASCHSAISLARTSSGSDTTTSSHVSSTIKRNPDFMWFERLRLPLNGTEGISLPSTSSMHHTE